MSSFIESRGEVFAREYGEYFQEHYKAFEEKLEEIKKEIHLSSLVEKTGKGEPLSATRIELSSKSQKESENVASNDT